MIKKDLPFRDYVDWPGINQSSFQDLDPDRDGCPAIWHFRNSDEGEPEERDSEALGFGRAFHSYALTPDAFDQEYKVEDADLYAEIIQRACQEIEAAKAEVDQLREGGAKVKDLPPALVARSRAKPPTAFSKSLDAWKSTVTELERVGVELIPARSFSTIESMWKSALKIPAVVALHADPEATELSISGDLDDGTGRKVRCKARLDLLSKSGEIHDLKTVQSAAPVALGRFIWKYRAYIQAAFYLDLAKAVGIEAKCFSWCFIDKRPPYPAVYHIAEPELIKLGRAGYQGFLQIIADCRERGHWPGHFDQPYYPEILNTLIEAVS